MVISHEKAFSVLEANGDSSVFAKLRVEEKTIIGIDYFLADQYDWFKEKIMFIDKNCVEEEDWLNLLEYSAEPLRSVVSADGLGVSICSPNFVLMDIRKNSN